jgi:hypothetical protein
VDENEDAATDIKQPPSAHQPAQTREERTLEVIEHALEVLKATPEGKAKRLRERP